MSKKEGLTMINSQQKHTHLRNIVTFLMSGLLLLSLSACFKTNNTPAQVQEQTGSSSSSLDTTNTNSDIDEWLIPLLSEYLADEPVDPCLDIQFPDAKLLAALREYSSPPIPATGPITCADMEQLTGFYGNYSGISDLTGLNYAINLKSIDLLTNNISDISPLTGLTKLTSINLGDNKITSIESGDFSGLTSLTSLNLNNNQIASIESGGFSGLSSLTSLNLNNNQIASIESGDFSGLTNLKELDLSRNSNLSFNSSSFNPLDKLETLALESVSLSNSDLAKLNGLTNLKNLGLAFNQISIVGTSLSNLTNLEKLSLGSNQLATINSIDLSSFPNLGSLNLGSNNITQIGSDLNLSSLSNLTFLNLTQNPITSTTGGEFDSLINLETLYMFETPLSTMASDNFKNLTKLIYAGLEDNQLIDISFMQPYAHRDLPSSQITIYGNCLDKDKIPTKGIVSALQTKTTNEYNDDPNPKATGCPTPLPKQANSMSAFDYDASLFDETEGWTSYNGATLGPATHSASFGQGGTGGYISVQHSGNLFITPSFIAPQQYYGDASDYKDGLLSYYLKSDAVNPDPIGNIQLTGGSPAKTLNYHFDTSTPSSSWTYYAVRLSPDGWTTIGGDATDADMDYVLADLTDFRIFGTRGSSTTGLDTVVMQKGYTSNPSTPIPDYNDTGIADIIVVPTTESASIEDLNVWVDITHTYVGDLTLSLKKRSSGTTVTLINKPTACTGDNLSTIFDDDATLEAQSNCQLVTTPAYSAKTVFEPVGDLSAFGIAGVPVDGEWELTVTDTGFNDTGTLNSWGLFFK